MSKNLKYRLKALREDTGLSLMDVCTAVGVHRQTMWLWERIPLGGRHSISGDHLLTIAKFYGLQAEELINDKIVA